MYRHLMTGLGAYCYLVWGIWLRHCLNHRQDEFEMHWPSLFTLPEVRKVSSDPAQDLKELSERVNGDAKKSK